MSFVLPEYTWGQEREQCKRCRHYEERVDLPRHNGGSMVMLCKVNPYKGKRGVGTCIDNRTRGPCGKAATLFQPKEIDNDLVKHGTQFNNQSVFIKGANNHG